MLVLSLVARQLVVASGVARQTPRTPEITAAVLAAPRRQRLDAGEIDRSALPLSRRGRASAARVLAYSSATANGKAHGWMPQPLGVLEEQRVPSCCPVRCLNGYFFPGCSARETRFMVLCMRKTRPGRVRVLQAHPGPQNTRRGSVALQETLSRSSWTAKISPRVTPASIRAQESSAFDSSQAQQKLRLITAAQRARPPKLLDLSQPSTRSAPVQQPWLRHRCERRSSSPRPQPSRRAPRACPPRPARGRRRFYK